MRSWDFVIPLVRHIRVLWRNGSTYHNTISLSDRSMTLT